MGAGSGRVFLCGFAPGELLLEEIHRFQYPPTLEENHLRWNFEQIFAEIKTGLRAAGIRVRALQRRIVSVGVDSWAVDYGLIDESGALLENPISYRDDRTVNQMEAVFSEAPRREIFAKTGIQFLPFNTLFQLFAHKKSGIHPNARKLLLMPDLINFFLTGKAVAEYTNATTTQMVNADGENWDFELLEKLDLPIDLLPEIVSAGTDLAEIKPDLARELGLENVRVVAPATHDTASAVAGAPLATGSAYISSGTWSLVGVELDRVLINGEVANHNFTNEGGAFGTIRFLKNVMGLWIFESCRREWQTRGIEIEYANLIGEIEKISEPQGFIFPDDARFLNPPQMLAAINAQLHETNQTTSENPVIIAKIIFDSLAFRYASVLRTIETLTAQKLRAVQIVGGGGRNRYLNQMTADATGLNIFAGLTEATVTGNALVQAVAAKRFASLTAARQHIADNLQTENFAAQISPETENLRELYTRIEASYLPNIKP